MAREDSQVSPRPRVLLVDDEPELRELLRRYLTGVPFDPEIAEDGAEALRLYREAKSAGRAYSLFVLDASMPDMSGFEVGQALRAEDETVKIAYLTGIDDAEAHWQADSIGVVGYWKKPDDLPRLKELICAAVGCDPE